MLGQARARAGKPLWITEFGWRSDCGDGSAACSEAAQANHVARNLAMLFKIGGVAKVFVFMFKDPGNQPDFYGITRADASVKPAFVAVQTIAERLAGLNYDGQVDLGVPGIWSMRFSSPNRTVDIVWSQSGAQDIQFPTADANVRVWRLDGSQQDDSASGGGVRLHVSNDPQLVERDGQALAPNGSSSCRYFAETHQSLCDGFLDFWEQYGGLMAFGYPISGELQERRSNRAVPGAHEVRVSPGSGRHCLGGDGRIDGTCHYRRTRTRPAFQRVADPHDAGCNYYAETGQTLCRGFKAYWEQHGGLWMFGYPISQELQERNPDTGEIYTVQYFERARFEWHPENAGTPYEVLLGRLGAQLYAARY